MFPSLPTIAKTVVLTIFGSGLTIATGALVLGLGSTPLRADPAHACAAPLPTAPISTSLVLTTPTPPLRVPDSADK
ncbi:hypothetical protein J7382_03815 [Shimia sp. R11_0]|uniref:hypothetical protein n=1 Tax=Shimia sp. R11_0 TaxID=2821096 RepID=UPI001ADA50E0|nr:hypothetical protein [Shimia sp. R11_0]MBO9476656.1 hypothetical protein [Shimia sp. R11_0]